MDSESKPTRMWPAGLVAVAIAALPSCCAGSSSATVPGPPVVVAVPSAAPSTVSSGGSGGCFLRQDQLPSGRDAVGLAAVDPNPEGATLLWLPGFGSRACTAQLAGLAAPAAPALARDILAAPAVAPGRYNCPADDAAAVIVYLRYPNPPNAEVADVALSGCAWIGAPGRTARRQTAAIRGDLRASAPADWAPYLQDR